MVSINLSQYVYLYLSVVQKYYWLLILVFERYLVAAFYSFPQRRYLPRLTEIQFSSFNLRILDIV